MRQNRAPIRIEDSQLGGDVRFIAGELDSRSDRLDPELGDIVQMQSGQCFIAASLLSIIYTDPILLRSAVRQSDEGYAVVTLYKTVGEDDKRHLEAVKYEVEVTDFQPAEDGVSQLSVTYHQHQTWASVLIKAYGIHQALEADPDLDANIPFLDHIISGGHSENVFRALTGVEPTTLSMERDEVESDIQYPKMMRAALVSSIIRILYTNPNVSDLTNDQLREFLKENIAAEDTGECTTACLNEIRAVALTYRAADDAGKNAITDALFARITPDAAIPEVADCVDTFIAKVNDEITSAVGQIFDNANLPALEPKPDFQVSNAPYNPLQLHFLHRIKEGIEEGNFLTATTPEIESGQEAVLHAGEVLAAGLAGNHAYGILGTCTRRDSDAIERHFIRLKNPWQSYAPEYGPDKKRREQEKQTGTFTQQHQQAVLFGPQSHASGDCQDLHTESLHASQGGTFEIELEDFCRQFDHITVSAPPLNASTKLAYDIEAFLRLSLGYIENERLRSSIERLLESLTDIDAARNHKERALIALNQLKLMQDQHQPLTPNSRVFLKSISELSMFTLPAEEDGIVLNITNAATKALSSTIKKATFNARECYGYSEDEIIKLVEAALGKTSLLYRGQIKSILASDDFSEIKILQIYCVLSRQLNTANAAQTEATHELLVEIQRHWKSQLYAEVNPDFYGPLVGNAHTIITDMVNKEAYSEVNKDIDAAKKRAQRNTVVQAAQYNPTVTGFSLFSIALIVTGIALQFTGVGAPIGLALAAIGVKGLGSAGVAVVVTANVASAVIASAVVTFITRVTGLARAIKNGFKALFNRFKRGKQQQPQAVAVDDADSETGDHNEELYRQVKQRRAPRPAAAAQEEHAVAPYPRKPPADRIPHSQNRQGLFGGKPAASPALQPATSPSPSNGECSPGKRSAPGGNPPAA